MAIVPPMTNPAETDRRLGDLLRYGEVCEVSGARCRVRIGDGLETYETHWLDMPMARAGAVRIWAPYTVGELVTLACPDGDIEAATILASHSTDTFAPPADPAQTRIEWADGSWIGFDPAGPQLTFLIANGKVAVIAPDGIDFDGDVSIRGAVRALGEIISDQDVKAGSVSLKNHDHEVTGALTKKPRQ